MIAWYTALALASENKVVSHSASENSIPRGTGFKDFVSIGPHWASKGCVIFTNTQYILTIEALVTFRAIMLQRCENNLGRRLGTA